MPRLRDLVLVPATLGAAVFGLLWGGRNSYIAIRNRHPVELTCAEYLRSPPDAEWLRLTGCVADLDHMGVERMTREPGHGVTAQPYDEPTEIFIPLRPLGVSAGTKTSLVMTSDEPDIMQVADDQASDSTVARIAAELDQPIEGVIELAVDRSERRKTELRDLKLRLADDFSILARNERPRPLWLSLAALFLGTAAASLMTRRMRRWLRHGQRDLAKATVIAGA